MAAVLRNITAFSATFIVIATVVMIIIHCVIAVICHKKEMSHKQEQYALWIGIAVALLLIPFYYFPA